MKDSPHTDRITQTQFVVIGAGGLGCPALLGLIAAGVRRLTIIDHDRVDASNLQRQVLFSLADVGVSKAEAARWALLGRTSTPLSITTIERRLDPNHLDPLFLHAVEPDSECSASPPRSDTLASLGPQGPPQPLVRELEPPAIVLECSDDPRLKFAIHDACFARGIPLVIAGVIGWRGQVMAVDPRARELACYRCLFESPPPRELAPACVAVGVVGAVAGSLGHAMALLAVGLAAHDPPAEPRAGALLNFDLLAGTVRRLAPARRPDCPTCERPPSNSTAWDGALL